MAGTCDASAAAVATADSPIRQGQLYPEWIVDGG